MLKAMPASQLPIQFSQSRHGDISKFLVCFARLFSALFKQLSALKCFLQA